MCFALMRAQFSWTRCFHLYIIIYVCSFNLFFYEMDVKQLTAGHLNNLLVIVFSGWWFSGTPAFGNSVQLTSDNFDTLIGEFTIRGGHQMADCVSISRERASCTESIDERNETDAGLILFGTNWCPFSREMDPMMEEAALKFMKQYNMHEVVFLNFYADWCHFSKILAPVFDEAAEKVTAKYHQDGRHLFGKVDCDKETALASRFHISKYPTLKLITSGQVAKKEYRGQRSADALVEFIGEQLKDPIKELESFLLIDAIQEKSRVVIGFFESKESPQFEAFRKASKRLRDSCEFYAGIGENLKDQRPFGDNIVFRPSRTKYGIANVHFSGAVHDETEVTDWATDLCIPFVRDITFENAEELTEEGLPFLILFHQPDDNDIVNKYTEEVKKQLSGDKSTINCLTADGNRFAHPLHHLGKSQKDLPLIAIDSFRHMYLFPDVKLMTEEGKLKQFVDDLYSGKLHREFHYGPDAVTNEVAHHPDSNEIPSGQPTSPPESTFKKLAPSRTRYTLLRDELYRGQIREDEIRMKFEDRLRVQRDN